MKSVEFVDGLLAGDCSKDERTALSRLKKELPRFLQALSEAKLKILPPRVLRGNPRGSNYFEHMGRKVCIQAELTVGGKTYDVSDLQMLGGWATYFGAEAHRDLWKWDDWPRLLIHDDFWKDHGWQHRKFDGNFCATFVVDCPKLREFQMELNAEWHRILNSRQAIVGTSLEKTGRKERAALRKKFAVTLVKASGLSDADPSAILKFFKLGHDDLKFLASFIKRNKADCEIVELEDIIEAQNIAKVEKVMKS